MPFSESKFFLMLSCGPGATVAHPRFGRGLVIDTSLGLNRLLVRFDVEKSQSGADLSEHELHALGVSADDIEVVRWTASELHWIDQCDLDGPSVTTGASSDD